MMKNKSLSTLAVVAAAYLMGSCNSMKEPDLRGIENVKMGKLGFKESTVSLDLHYFNPNKSRLKLKSAEGDAWVDERLLGHFIIDTLVHIPGKADFWLPAKLKVDMKNIPQNLSSAFLQKEVTIKIDGMARLGKGMIFINYPIHYEGKQNLGELLK